LIEEENAIQLIDKEIKMVDTLSRGTEEPRDSEDLYVAYSATKWFRR